MRGLLLLFISAAITLPSQTRPLPEAGSLKLDVPAIFDVLWFESLLTHFTGVGSAASVLRFYTYTEYDTVSLMSTRTTYRLGPYHAIGTQNKRVWFQEFVDELRFRDVERKDRDRMSLQGQIHRTMESNVE